MDKRTETVSVLQVSMILMSSAGIIDHVIVIPMLLQSAGRDSWLSILFAGVIFAGWILWIYFIIKRMEKQHILDWLKQRTGAAIAWTIIAMVNVLLFFTGAFTLRDTTVWTNISYLPKTPNLILVLLFGSICLYSAYSGIRTMAITNGILLPFVVIFGWFVALSNIPNKDYSLLLPVFEHGFDPVLKGMVYAGSGFRFRRRWKQLL
ncbi:hypothetical protein skT53_34750 [Effusibacillus dendaii]|uniref:Spore germination protein n=1 Tax=Effusibacillus dendaii TaxID=2743772 RepID=A0A7I8DIK0_9BACL|nr:GerAB/ArcD/ProY family transporter [Effusibacillus dendaii]BCJ88490.1 hypothetical protein skT53_34750 [Effusibacillus dendaii]